jgi:hypothetical protein
LSGEEVGAEALVGGLDAEEFGAAVLGADFFGLFRKTFNLHGIGERGLGFVVKIQAISPDGLELFQLFEGAAIGALEALLVAEVEVRLSFGFGVG